MKRELAGRSPTIRRGAGKRQKVLIGWLELSPRRLGLESGCMISWDSRMVEECGLEDMSGDHAVRLEALVFTSCVVFTNNL